MFITAWFGAAKKWKPKWPQTALGPLTHSYQIVQSFLYGSSTHFSQIFGVSCHFSFKLLGAPYSWQDKGQTIEWGTLPKFLYRYYLQVSCTLHYSEMGLMTYPWIFHILCIPYLYVYWFICMKCPPVSYSTGNSSFKVKRSLSSLMPLLHSSTFPGKLSCHFVPRDLFTTVLILPCLIL